MGGARLCFRVSLRIAVAKGRPLAHRNCLKPVHKIFAELLPLPWVLGSTANSYVLELNPPPNTRKVHKMLLSIASANVGYWRVQPRLRSFALLTRLLLFPRLRCPVDFPIGGSGRSSLRASQR